MNSVFARDFKGIWISKEIWFDNRLSHEEKILLAEVDSLDCGAPRHCYASNEYFSKFMNCGERHLREMLSHLRSLGLIESVGFDGRERNIKSNIGNTQAIFNHPSQHQAETNKNNFKQHRQNLTGLGGTMPPPSSIGDSIERDNKDDNKEREIFPLTPKHGGNPPISPKGGPVEEASKSRQPKKIREEKKERVDRVWLTDKQEESLKLKLNNDEIQLKLCYQKLSDWKISKGIMYKANDYLAILKWVIKAVNKEIEEESTASNTSTIPGCHGLNDVQEQNWRKNYLLVMELIEKLPSVARGLNFFYKNHILKDKLNFSFSVKGLINPEDFRRVLEKHLGIQINEA